MFANYDCCYYFRKYNLRLTLFTQEKTLLSSYESQALIEGGWNEDADEEHVEGGSGSGAETNETDVELTVHRRMRHKTVVLRDFFVLYEVMG